MCISRNTVGLVLPLWPPTKSALIRKKIQCAQVDVSTQTKETPSLSGSP